MKRVCSRECEARERGKWGRRRNAEVSARADGRAVGLAGRASYGRGRQNGVESQVYKEFARKWDMTPQMVSKWMSKRKQPLSNHEPRGRGRERAQRSTSLLASAKELLDTGGTAPPTAEQQRKALELLGLMDTMRKGQEKERVEETSALKKQGPPAPPVAVPVKRDRGGTALAPASTARAGQTLPGEGASAHGTTDATPGPHDEREGLTPSPDGQTASDPPATASRGSRASS
jgi:hypothetical protein